MPPSGCEYLNGLWGFNNTRVLTANFAFRKNIRRGSVLKRPCVCADLAGKARDWCPIHAMWEYLQKRVSPAERLSPTCNKPNVNRILETALRKAGFGNSGIGPSHSGPPPPEGPRRKSLLRAPRSRLSPRRATGLPRGTGVISKPISTRLSTYIESFSTKLSPEDPTATSTPESPASARSCAGPLISSLRNGKTGRRR